MSNWVPTYIITRDKEREKRTRFELAKVGLADPTIVPGVDGHTNRENKVFTLFCRLFCTEHMMGCALAHLNAWKRIFEDEHQFALLVEDDISIQYPDTFREELNTYIEALPPHWDFVSLFCQGLCSHDTRIGRGSMAASLISRHGCQKLLDIKIGYHIDYVKNIQSLNSFLGPQLFNTYDDKTGVLIGNQSLSFWNTQDILGICNYRVTSGQCVFVILCLACLALWFPSSQIRGICSVLVLFMIAFLINVCLYFTYFTQCYKCHPKKIIVAIISTCLFSIWAVTQSTALVQFLSFLLLTFCLVYFLDSCGPNEITDY